MDMCTINPTGPGACNGTDPSTPGTGLGNGYLAFFKDSSQSYFATDDTYFASSATITWWRVSNNALVNSFSDVINNGTNSWAYFTPFSFGDAVYWIRVLYDASNAVREAILYSANVNSATAKTALSSNIGVDTYRIIDVNALSVLLTGPAGLYRVALPNGNAGALPPLLVNVGSALVTGATEDASGVYWLQNDGTLFRCTPPGCTDKKALATGQTPVGDLYQNDAAIFWSNNGVIMRLAK
jgi:hypothetical protein